MHEYDVQIRWKNFRSFKDTGWLKIKPITILIGPNNAGKTSILAPLLLLNQTLTSRDADRALITRGDLVDVGSYKDLIHGHDTRELMSLTVGFHLHDENSKEFHKSSNDFPGALEVTFDHGEKADIALKHYSVLDIYRRPLLKRSRNKTGGFSVSGSFKMQDFQQQERKIMRKDEPTNFFFTPTSVLHRHTRLEHSSGDSSGEPDFSTPFSKYLITTGSVFTALRSFFYPLSYLGPIRAWPRRYYETLSEDRLTVGPKGEYTAALLQSTPKIGQKINEWVSKFGFGKRLEISELSRGLFEVDFVGENGEVTNIADAGFGASQLLPLIVQALAIDEDAVFVAEQPEIHLNPSLQVTLSDLFVEVAKAGRKVVLETHSEHLLLRLRRLVAEEEITPDQVALYFVERQNGRSTIREVPIEPDGHIPQQEWPRAFFQDALRESLALATTQAGRSSK